MRFLSECVTRVIRGFGYHSTIEYRLSERYDMAYENMPDWDRGMRVVVLKRRG